MRVINIIGHSNSGKTTLVTQLVPLLAKVGTVCTIKHMGHHIWELPPGKDTTVHYDAGADCSAGIDAEKTVITLRDTDVYRILDFYAWMGYDYAVVEGFKEEGFSCAILGDLSAEHCILTNPSVDELFAARDLFDEHVPKR